MDKEKSLLVCGKCGYDQSKDEPDKKRALRKVILAGLANILCRRCEVMLEDEIADIAARYLD